MPKKAGTRSSGSRSRSQKNIQEVVNARGQRRSGNPKTINFESLRGKDYKEVMSDILSSPAVKYVAGGIAAAFLTRIANNMSDRYPEISSFIRENLENMQGKLGEFKDSFRETSSTRH